MDRSEDPGDDDALLYPGEFLRYSSSPPAAALDGINGILSGDPINTLSRDANVIFSPSEGSTLPQAPQLASSQNNIRIVTPTSSSIETPIVVHSPRTYSNKYQQTPEARTNNPTSTDLEPDLPVGDTCPQYSPQACVSNHLPGNFNVPPPQAVDKDGGEIPPHSSSTIPVDATASAVTSVPVASAPVALASIAPTPVSIFSNVDARTPWYIPVLTFAAEPTRTLQHPGHMHQSLPGYPPCTDPVPSGLTLGEYISGCPNHLIYDGLDCCIQRHLSARQIFARLDQNAKDLLSNMRIESKQQDSHNVLQRRLDERIAKLGREGIIALKKLPWLRDDPANVQGKAQPFNLNPNAPLRPTKEDREKRKKNFADDKDDEEEEEDQAGAETEEPARPNKRRVTHRYALQIVQPPVSAQPALSGHVAHEDTQSAHNPPTDDVLRRFSVEFNLNVSAYSCLDEPLGRFWTLTYWDNEEQYLRDTGTIKNQLQIMWDMANQLLQQDVHFANRHALYKCRLILHLLRVVGEAADWFQERLAAADQTYPNTGEPGRAEFLVDMALRGVFAKHISSLFRNASYAHLVKVFGEQLGRMQDYHFDHAVLVGCRLESGREIGNLLLRIRNRMPQLLQMLKDQEQANVVGSMPQ